jgi:ankyrin repeat protein
LLQAVEVDDLQTVQRLLASGEVVVTERDEGGTNAALLAAALGHFYMLEWLLTVNPNNPNNSNNPNNPYNPNNPNEAADRGWRGH